MACVFLIPYFSILFFIVSDIYEKFLKLRVHSQLKADVWESAKSHVFDSQADLRQKQRISQTKRNFIQIFNWLDFVAPKKLQHFSFLGDEMIADTAAKTDLFVFAPEVNGLEAKFLDSQQQKIYAQYQGLKKAYHENQNNPSLLTAYTDAGIVLLQSGLLETEALKTRLKLSQVFDRLFQTESAEKLRPLPESYFESAIENDLALGKKMQAFNRCRHYAEIYPTSERPLYLFLKIFYVVGDKKYFFRLLQYVREHRGIESKRLDACVKFWEPV